ncbi:MAG: hypothetical protein CFE26_27070, partial [Verrucomicrobiales bacterium VVV1]
GALLLATMLAVSAFGASRAFALPRAVTLEAIHQIENPHDVTRPGPRGELGAYQFRAMTWAQHSRRPFADALDRRWSDEVAVRHYDWLCERLMRNGLEPSVYNLALAWNAGLSAALRGRAPRRSHDYALRVGNIAGDLHQGTLLAAK